MEITKKFKLSVYLLLASLSIILLLLGLFASEGVLKDILLNLSTEIGGAVILFFIVERLFDLSSLNNNKSSNNNLLTPSISAVHDIHPLSLFKHRAKSSKRKIRILGTWLYNQNPIPLEVIQAIKNGIEVQILLLDYNSKMVEQRLIDLDGIQDKNAVISGFNVMKVIIEKEKLFDYKFNLRLYDSVPPFRLHQVDSWILLGIYFHGVSTSSSPQVEILDENCSISNSITNTFDKMWDKAKPYNF